MMQTAKIRARKRRRNENVIWDSRGDRILYAVAYGLMALSLLVVGYPLIYVLSASFSNGNAIQTGKVFLWPVDVTLAGYEAVFKHQLIVSGYINTILYTGVGTFLNVCATMICAYPLSRRDMQWKGFYMFVFVFTMYFGGGLVPYYMVLKGIHMLNTFWVFIFPLMMSVYNMILVRSYVESMPESLFEAAKIDGATDLTVFFRLVLPLSKTILMTIGLFVAVNQWNSWFDAYLYTSAQSLKPMQSVLVEILNQYQTGGSVSQQMSNAKSGMTVTPDSIRMAATMVATIPIIMVYPFIQK